jgi:hypothetical protein
MRGRASMSAEQKRAATVHRHFRAHQHAKHLGHVKKMNAAAREASEHGKTMRSITRIGQMPIMVAELRELAENGMAALRKAGTVTLFQWPAEISAAGYASAARPRHFVRVESGDFPKRMRRTYERLRQHAGVRRILSLVEIRALHAHLIWAHTPRRSNEDVLVSLLPNLLDLRPGKEYARVEVERHIREAAGRMFIESQ